MTPLLIVLPYCPKDAHLAKELVSWIAELKTPRAAAILLAADTTVPRETIDDIASIAKRTFSFVKTMLVPVTPGGWPPNKMFLTISNQISEQYRWPFFWMEPDVIPLTSAWLEELENAYSECPKKFMGSLVQQDKNPGLPKIHLNGVAVYPADVHRLIRNIDDIKTGKNAWDIASAATIVPKAVHTDLIFHFWGKPDLAPTFVPVKVPGTTYSENTFELSQIPKQAVIMHRCKDGSLINALRSVIAPPKNAEPSSTITTQSASDLAPSLGAPSPQRNPTPPFVRK